MEAMIDVCIYLIIFGGSALIVYGIVYAILHRFSDLRQLKIDERIHKNRAEYRAGWRRAENAINHK